MEETNQSYLKASFWERLLAGIIDEIILITIYLILYGVLQHLNFKIPSVIYFTSTAIGIIYNIWLVYWKGATIGKKIMKIKVVRSSYEKVSLSKVILRETIGKWLSKIFNLGYLWVLIDEKRQAWHDKLADTFVVKVDEKGQMIFGENAPITKKAYFLFFSLFVIFNISMLFSIFVLFYLFIAEPVQIKGQAMAPNYLNNQYYLVNKITYIFFSPKRGDVVIFTHPENNKKLYFKRIVGLPGEEIKIENGKVYINNEILQEQYLPQNTYTKGGMFLKEGVAIKIPQEHYVVLSDDRKNSNDSREWGFVPRKNIIGKLWFRYY